MRLGIHIRDVRCGGWIIGRLLGWTRRRSSRVSLGPGSRHSPCCTYSHAHVGSIVASLVVTDTHAGRLAAIVDARSVRAGSRVRGGSFAVWPA